MSRRGSAGAEERHVRHLCDDFVVGQSILLVRRRIRRHYRRGLRQYQTFSLWALLTKDAHYVLPMRNLLHDLRVAHLERALLVCIDLARAHVERVDDARDGVHTCAAREERDESAAQPRRERLREYDELAEKHQAVELRSADTSRE